VAEIRTQPEFIELHWFGLGVWSKVALAFTLVLDAAVGITEKRLMKWQPKSGETEKL